LCKRQRSGRRDYSAGSIGIRFFPFTILFLME
jgi:hypothetical protein